MIIVMETCCVFFAVRTELVNIISTNFGFKGLNLIFLLVTWDFTTILHKLSIKFTLDKTKPVPKRG
jgi:hypothetical protein